MRPGAMVAALVVASMALAGCSGQSGSKSDGGATGGPGAAGSGKGVLAGIVVDDAIRPVEGALVNVTGGGAEYNATTGADGQFRVMGLAPGAYVVRVSKQYYSPHEQAVVVETGVTEPELVRFQLVFEASSVPFATVYKYEGFHECGFNFVRVCSNVNIATGIVVCGYNENIPCFNVTSDTSLFFQRIDGIPTFVQAELVWTPSTDFGSALNFYIGGGNVSELQRGTASTYNFTSGESPLMLRITNHEGENAWCASRPTPCEVPRTLNWSRIGTERALLGQVDAGPSIPSPLPPNPACDNIAGRCAVGFSAQQPFTMFTTVFYGYEPPADWRFAVDGEPPPPPA